MSTRAIQFLKQKEIPFSVVEYEHTEKGAKFASEALDFPIEKTVKTLVVDLVPKGYALVLIPGDKTLSTKKLSRSLSVKRTKLVDVATAERVTDYKVGGISPFGTKQRIPVIMEQSLLGVKTVAINAGKRGVMLMMNPKDIVRALEAKIGELADA